jgi:hypothetical protein
MCKAQIQGTGEKFHRNLFIPTESFKIENSRDLFIRTFGPFGLLDPLSHAGVEEILFRRLKIGGCPLLLAGGCNFLEKASSYSTKIVKNEEIRHRKR